MAVPFGVGAGKSLSLRSLELEANPESFLGAGADLESDLPRSRGHDVPLHDGEAPFPKLRSSVQVQSQKTRGAWRPDHDSFDLVDARTEVRPEREGLTGRERA